MRRHAERLLTLLERILTATLYPFCVIRERFGRARLAILMYHQVGDPLAGVSGGDECVSPRRFETQIRALLEAGYRPASLGYLLGGRRGGGFSRRQVAITFDDGFRGQFQNALPVLRRYKIPATFFLVAGVVGRDRPLPHLSVSTGLPAATTPGEWLPLTREQARRLAGEGMTIGSHSLTHRSLGHLDSAQVDDEARSSKRLLEEQVGAHVDLFAYPFGSQAYGDFDRGAGEILRGAGYLGACTTVVGRNRPDADRMALRRIPIEEGDGPFRLRCKLAGAYDWVGPAKTLWQRMMRRRERIDQPLLLGVK